MESFLVFFFQLFLRKNVRRTRSPYSALIVPASSFIIPVLLLLASDIFGS